MTSNGVSMRRFCGQSVLDNELDALSIVKNAPTTPETPKETKMSFERVDMDENVLVVMGDQSFSVAKSKGPSSLLGTWSSIVSASDHSEVSDFESDSGIDNSHARTTSPEMGVTMSAKNKKRKGLKTFPGVLPRNNLVAANGAGGNGSGCSYNQTDCFQSNCVGEQRSCDFRIDSYISCLDNKVSIILRCFAQLILGPRVSTHSMCVYSATF